MKLSAARAGHRVFPYLLRVVRVERPDQVRSTDITHGPLARGFMDLAAVPDCITWIERLGLPLLTGRMDEFTALPGRASHASRRFGRCL